MELHLNAAERGHTYTSLLSTWQVGDGTPQTVTAAVRIGWAEALAFHAEELPELMALANALGELFADHEGHEATALAINGDTLAKIAGSYAKARAAALMAGLFPTIHPDGGAPLFTDDPDATRPRLISLRGSRWERRKLIGPQ